MVFVGNDNFRWWTLHNDKLLYWFIVALDSKATSKVDVRLGWLNIGVEAITGWGHWQHVKYNTILLGPKSFTPTYYYVGSLIIMLDPKDLKKQITSIFFISH